MPARTAASGAGISAAQQTLDELQDGLRSRCMVRRLKADVLTELPAKRRSVIEIPANGKSKSGER